MSDNQQNIAKLDQIIQLANEVKADLSGAAETIVPAGADLQSYINAASPNAVLVLEAGIYEGSVQIEKPITIKALNYQGQKPSRDMQSVILGNDSTAMRILNLDSSGWVKLLGIGITNANNQGSGIDIYGVQTEITNCAVWGDPTNGLRRGILANGQVMTITNIWMDDIILPGRDSQCIMGYDGTDNLTINGAYLCGGAETIMFGGGDSQAEDRMPKNIRIENFHLTKKREWYQEGMQIKNAFELKAANNVYVNNGLMEYAGMSEGQRGFIILLSVRNQDGTAPWTTVKNVTIENVNCRYGGACVSVLGIDDNQPSVMMESVVLRNLNFTNIDPTGITGGSGNCIQFSSACKAVTFDSISIEGKNLNSLGYFPPAGQQPIQLTLRNWKFPETAYGWKIDAGGMDVPPAHDKLSAYMPDMVYEITANDPGASPGFPQFPTSVVRYPTKNKKR